MPIKLTMVYAAVSAGVMLLAGSASAADIPALRFGYQCQAEYESSWQGELPNACASAEGFRDGMIAAGSTKVFNYNGTGTIGTRILEDANDVWSKVEDVDIMYLVGHGGAWSRSGASFPSYRDGLRAYSKNMRLGDEGRGLAVLVAQVCAVGAWWPRNAGDGTSTPSYEVTETLPIRWSSAFRGGLKLLLTSWDHGKDTKTNGAKFAANLSAGYTFQEAWKKAAFDSHGDNDPSVAATGTTTANCWDRLNDLKASNIRSTAYPRLQDNQVGAFCQNFWTNDSKRDVCRSSVPGCDCAKSTCN